MKQDKYVVITVARDSRNYSQYLFLSYADADNFCLKLKYQGTPYHDSRPVMSEAESKQVRKQNQEIRRKYFG